MFLAEQRGASEEERIGMMRKIQETLHSQANYYRSLNIAETSKEIQTLQKMWWQYEKSISTIRLDSMKKKAADMESVASYVADKYNQRIKDLKETRRLEEESWNARINAIRSKNEALEDNIALQEAQEALARAKANKVRVYREGQGFVYEEDVTAVSEARKNLDKLNREQQLKDEVARLEKLKKQALDNIDTQIKRWEDYSKSWSEVASNYKKDQDKLLAEQVFGINTEKAGWEERLRTLRVLLHNIMLLWLKLVRQVWQAQVLQLAAEVLAVADMYTLSPPKRAKILHLILVLVRHIKHLMVRRGRKTLTEALV